MAKKSTVVDTREYLYPVGKRMLVSKPQAVGSGGEKKTKAGIIVVQQSAYTRREFGLVAKVFRVGGEVKKFEPGDCVLVSEYAGLPVWNEVGRSDSWIVVEDEVIAKVDPRYLDVVAADPDPTPNASGDPA